MKPTLAQLNDFRANRPIPGVAFGRNDYINVTSGVFSGASGTVIGLEALGSDPVYTVALESGQKVLLAASSLQPEGES